MFNVVSVVDNSTETSKLIVTVIHRNITHTIQLNMDHIGDDTKQQQEYQHNMTMLLSQLVDWVDNKTRDGIKNKMTSIMTEFGIAMEETHD